MGEAGARLWISQADSDLWAASRLYVPTEARSYCQAISKYQQVVEKSVKALAAAMRDRFILVISIGYDHKTERIVSALRQLRSPAAWDIHQHVNKLLKDSTIREIKALDALAPKRPSPAQLHAKNTEYPYETIAGNWTAPALPNAFSTREVIRFQHLAQRIYVGAKEIVVTLGLAPNP